MRREFMISKEPRLLWKTLLRTLDPVQQFTQLSGRSSYDCFLARNAIYHGLAVLGIKAGENILVPAFHCRAAIDPIVAYGSEIRFYDVNRDLSPNFHDIQEKIDQKSRGVLIIHYFGFPQPLEKWQQLCKQHQLYLIEDCAHVLTGRAPDGSLLGEVGDISVFSWRKFLPMYDGARLVINSVSTTYNPKFEKGDLIVRLKAAKDMVDRLLERSLIGNCVSAVLGLSSRAIRNWMLVNSDRVTTLKVNSYDVEFDPATVNLRMTTLSKRIIQNSDMSTVMKKRRDNYKRLTEAVHGMPGVVAPLFPILPEEICPWIFPMVTYGTKDLQPVLRAKGIPVTSWSGVIHRAFPLESFPNARFLYENLLFLPVHQSLGIEDLQTVICILRKTVDEAVRRDQSRDVYESSDASTPASLPPIEIQ
jgi:perosamine synthetase